MTYPAFGVLSHPKIGVSKIMSTLLSLPSSSTLYRISQASCWHSLALSMLWGNVLRRDLAFFTSPIWYLLLGACFTMPLCNVCKYSFSTASFLFFLFLFFHKQQLLQCSYSTSSLWSQCWQTFYWWIHWEIDESQPFILFCIVMRVHMWHAYDSYFSSLHKKNEWVLVLFLDLKFLYKRNTYSSFTVWIEKK